MSVKVLRLVSGEEVIATITSGSDSGYFLENPAQILLQQGADGKVGVGLAPFMAYVAGKVYLNKFSVAAEGDPVVQMMNEYSRLFGSGIQLMTPGSFSV